MIKTARIVLIGALALSHPAQTAFAQAPKDVEDFLSVSRSIRNSEPVYTGSDFEKGLQAFTSLRSKLAFGFFEKAARSGHVEAQYYLGMMYFEGDGVEKNSENALKWLRQSARKKNADAENLLGVMYFSGDGVTEDPTEAARWFRLAADHGQVTAHENLGSMYLEGNGVPKDEREAARLFRIAAEQDSTSAQVALGTLYLQGVGVPRDPVQSAKWFLVAGRAGDMDAFDYLESLLENGSFTKEQVDQASLEADAWEASKDE
ncbi:MAG: sel1 repeat family protein [Alphaproteobacteria bacterium]|nr:sel1 repeat family protein [Alphaproteobacteria bacterium]